MRKADRWYNRIVRDSKHNDKRQGREIKPTLPYIDTNTLLEFQQLQQNKCYYCQCEMNWMERRSSKNGLTLERDNNALPHYKTNCVGLCCKSCNSKKYSTDKGLLKRYFCKWRDLALGIHYKHELRSACYMN